MSLYKYSLLVILLAFTTFAQARQFEKIVIPGAICGNGSEYSIWLDMKNPKKLLVEFMGGGACWSDKTCFGSKIRTWIFPIPTSPVISWISNDVGSEGLEGLLAGHSMIYFPYCTGDVHAADHDARYGETLVHHRGKSNVEKALKHLLSKQLLNHAQFQELVVYGASAGAIGAIIHGKNISKLAPKAERKILLADAPGMHFGEQFWHKFPEHYFYDLQKTFSSLDLNVGREDHVLARFAPQMSQYYQGWRLGVLQGARDVVMGPLFGDISSDRHRELVYSEVGLFHHSQFATNMSVWLPDTLMHTFLLTKTSARVQSQNMSAKEFAQFVISGEGIRRER